MRPRWRKAAPVELDLSDDAVLKKFVTEAVERQNEFRVNHVRGGLDAGFNLVENDEARDVYMRQETNISLLLDECKNYCPHIDTVPFPRPHLFIPAVNVTTCLVCADDFLALLDSDDHCCDLCGKESVGELTQVRFGFGPGLMIVWLGPCCVRDFSPRIAS